MNSVLVQLVELVDSLGDGTIALASGCASQGLIYYPTVPIGRHREVFDSCWIWLSELMYVPISASPACIPGVHI